MGFEEDRKSQSQRGQANQQAHAASKPTMAPGKRTLAQGQRVRPAGAPSPVQQKTNPAADAARSQRTELTKQWVNTATRPDLAPPPVQLDEIDGGEEELMPHDGSLQTTGDVQRAARHGISGTSSPLPHLDRIQQTFGRHDVSHIQAHIGGPAAEATRAMGAEAYATGMHVAFQTSPTLRTAAHEAAHVVQQRGGVQLEGGVGQAGDRYEQHADAVADRVVQGKSAVDLLDGFTSGSSGDAVQRQQLPPQQSNDPAPADDPLQALRDAVDAGDANATLVAYQTLGAAAKARLRANGALVTEVCTVLDSGSAGVVIEELALERAIALQVASRSHPNDDAFLTGVLRQQGLGNLSSLAAAADELSGYPAFVSAAVLDPIINAEGTTAMAQLGLASDPGGEALLRTAWPGQTPLQLLTALAADLGVVRGGFESSAGFQAWLLEDEQRLEGVITTTLDGMDWARAMWSNAADDVLVGWIARNPSYWGQALGEGLLAPNGTDASILLGSPHIANAVFAAIFDILGIDQIVQVVDALHFSLAQSVRVLSDAGRLDADTLALLLNGPTVDIAAQDELTQDPIAIGVIWALASPQYPHEVLSILAGDPVAFIDAVGRGGVFTDWVTGDMATLAIVMAALPSWNAWIDAFQSLNAWDTLLAVAADPAIQGDIRAAIVAKGAWGWLVGACPRPITDNLLADTLLQLYGDGTGIAFADKLTTWAALYRTPLKRAGEDMVFTWRGKWLSTWEKRYYAVDPNDDAMNLFFHQFRQMPRAHVDTAAGVMMCHQWRKKNEPLIGSTKYYDANDREISAPGHNIIPTSYYFSNNMIVMRATNGSGAPNTDQIKSQWGTPRSVNTPGVDPLSRGATRPMTYFQNHATHEVGHAVGNRRLRRGAYDVTGDDFTRQYASWQQNGTAEGYATTLGWDPAWNAVHYTVTDGNVPPVQSVTVTGREVRDFLTGIAGRGLSSQDGSKLGRAFGGAGNALARVAAHPVLGTRLLVTSVHKIRGDLPDRCYVFPDGLDASATTVHFFATRWGNRWVTYDADAWRNKVSLYAVSSYKEMFAEIYTAKFTGGMVPGALNGMDMPGFLAELAAADPTELGLPAYGAASPGAGATAGEQGPGAGEAPQSATTDADEEPAEARGRPL